MPIHGSARLSGSFECAMDVRGASLDHMSMLNMLNNPPLFGIDVLPEVNLNRAPLAKASIFKSPLIIPDNVGTTPAI